MGLSFSVLWVITKLTFLRGGEAGLNQFELAFLLLATKCALTETNNINSKIASKSVEFPISKMVHEKHQGKSIRTGNALLLATPKPHLAFLIEICVCYLKQRMRANKRKAVDTENLHPTINQIAQQAFHKGWICLTERTTL